MKQYLDCLQQVHEERSRHVYEIDDFDDEVPPMGTYTESVGHEGVLICCTYRHGCASTRFKCY
jgi:hypothetical protein